MTLDQNRKCCLSFAKKFSNLTAEDWEKFFFSDESKFNLINSDGRSYVRRKNESMNKKCVTLTVKFGGGNVMYWGGFSALGVGPLVKVKNTLKQSDYIHLLEKEFLTYSNENLPPGWYFQQDNASCHKGKKTIDWFKSNGIDLVDWLAQSPDLSPIENLWGIIKARIKKEKPQNMQDLKSKIVKIWKEIPNDLCLKLAHSMPNRLAKVIDNKGYAINY